MGLEESLRLAKGLEEEEKEEEGLRDEEGILWVFLLGDRTNNSLL